VMFSEQCVDYCPPSIDICCEFSTLCGACQPDEQSFGAVA